MKKYYKFIFMALFGLFVFLPKDTFALDFSSSPYYCKYYDGVMDECGNAYYGQFVNAANNFGWYAPNTTINNFVSSSNNYVRLEHYNQSFCDGDGQGYGGTVDFYYWFDNPIAKYFTTSNFDMNFDPLAFTCTHEVTLDGYGLVFHCSTNKSFTNATIGTNMRYVSVGDTYLGQDAIVGVGTWTATYECTTNETDIIVNNNNANTDKIINNQDENTDKIIENENKNHEEDQETKKGIWESIKELPSKFMDMLKSLFIPDDEYFTTKFDELTDNITGVLGFLGYPFTLITNTFEFFMTVEDTGEYIIKWPDIPVPNFEEFNIIEAGEYDLGELLENDKIAGLRNIAFVFINAYLLLAFLQLCKNQYNRVFGGDVSETEFISVAEEYDIDYKTGEVSNIKHIEKKTTRRDIN